MESYLTSEHYDLVSPDGFISKLKKVSESILEATVFITKISPVFVGFGIDKEKLFYKFFILKRTEFDFALDF